MDTTSGESVLTTDDPPKPRQSDVDTAPPSEVVVRCAADCSQCVVSTLVRIGIDRAHSHQEAHRLQELFTRRARGFVTLVDPYTLPLARQEQALQRLRENFMGCHQAMNGTRVAVVEMLRHAQLTMNEAIDCERRLYF